MAATINDSDAINCAAQCYAAIANFVVRIRECPSRRALGPKYDPVGWVAAISCAEAAMRHREG